MVNSTVVKKVETWHTMLMVFFSDIKNYLQNCGGILLLTNIKNSK